MAAKLEIFDLQIIFGTLCAVLHLELIERQLNGAHGRTRPAHVVVALDRTRIVSVAVAGRLNGKTFLAKKLWQTVQVVRAGQLADQILVVVVERIDILIWCGWQVLEIVRAVAVCGKRTGGAVETENIEIF